ncbi:class I SAM-dependent methyltransferase [Brachybacterium sp. AOP25-B2-12]|uniref:class I SAM-dependent methyltransferase n=1 Tax=Brachybacterium sp. AOP25-B2-12 TaxID=3457710 RepID=UPI004034D499
MGIRDLAATRWGIPAARALGDLNARHPWNHNDHFHSWILAHLPERRHAALDVGCGRGGLVAELAPSFDTVLGIDRDDAMRRAAADRCTGIPAVRIAGTPFEALEGPFDLVTMVAVLHHLELAPALQEVRRLLAPGGRLLVVGLAVPRTPRDRAWDVASMVTNPLIGLVKHPWPHPADAPAAPIPVADPSLSFSSIRAVARRELPGARMRHRLGFRYTLAWEAPATQC